MWWSIEVFDGAFPATLWQDAHGGFLIEAAVTRRGRDWWWHRHDWGVVFEVEFDDEDAWEACMRRAHECDLFIAIFDGQAGWRLDGETVGICEAELSAAVQADPSKVWSVTLDPLGPRAG